MLLHCLFHLYCFVQTAHLFMTFVTFMSHQRHTCVIRSRLFGAFVRRSALFYLAEALYIYIYIWQRSTKAQAEASRGMDAFPSSWKTKQRTTGKQMQLIYVLSTFRLEYEVPDVQNRVNKKVSRRRISRKRMEFLFKFNLVRDFIRHI